MTSCVGCGCDAFHRCEPDGCYWLRVDTEAKLGVCSSCSEHVESWDQGERIPHATSAAEEEAFAEGRLRIHAPERPKQVFGKDGRCLHDWPYDEEVRDGDRCRWCGMTFVRHIFTECP